MLSPKKPCRLLWLEQISIRFLVESLSNQNKNFPAGFLDFFQTRYLCSFPNDNQVPTAPSTSPSQWEEVDLEEQQLRQKLHKMTDNISDHSLTSDEDEPNRPYSSAEVTAWRSSSQGDPKPSRIPTRPTSRASTANSRLEDEMLLQSDSQKVKMSLVDIHVYKAKSCDQTCMRLFTDKKEANIVNIWPSA